MMRLITVVVYYLLLIIVAILPVLKLLVLIWYPPIIQRNRAIISKNSLNRSFRPLHFIIIGETT